MIVFGGPTFVSGLDKLTLMSLVYIQRSSLLIIFYFKSNIYLNFTENSYQYKVRFYFQKPHHVFEIHLKVSCFNTKYISSQTYRVVSESYILLILSIFMTYLIYTSGGKPTLPPIRYYQSTNVKGNLKRELLS